MIPVLSPYNTNSNSNLRSLIAPSQATHYDIDFHKEVDMNIRDHMVLEKLEALEKQEPDAYLAKRIRTIILAIKGFTVGDIVLSLGVPSRTVQSWVECYNKDGSKMFKERRGGDRRETLTEEQKAGLKKRIDDGPKTEDGVCVFARRRYATYFGARVWSLAKVAVHLCPFA